MARLADLLRPLESAEDIKARASEALGEHLSANRALYFEVAGSDYVVERDHNRGVPSLAGRYPMVTFGPALVGAFAGGRTVAEPDVQANPAVSESERAAFAAVQIGSFIGVPLVKAGVLVAGLSIQQSQPRDWTDAEITLVEETAERTWDAVERARATRQLRASERLRRVALDAAGLGVWSVDPADMSLTTDERFREIFHGSADPSPYSRAFGAIHPEDQSRIADAVAAATRAEDTAAYAEEYRVVRPDGSQRWVFATGRASVANGHSGKRVESFDGTLQDITERKEAEQREQESESRAAEARKERDRLLGELQAQDRRKDEFLAMLSHELRNPLAPIANAVQLLRLQSGDDPRQMRAMGIIERQVGQLKRLVDDLLEVSRITTGRVQLRQDRIAVGGVVDAAVETARPLIERRGHHLAVTIAVQPIWLNADAARLEQVLVNLLTNAAKYSNEGSQIWVTAALEGEEAVLRIRDTGFGIASDLLPHIFELFTQADRSLARSEGGLGIGLALVKRLAELHGGRVEVMSTLGQGSEFVVRLPAADQEWGEQESSRVAPVRPVSRSRILVVDDSLDSVESLAELLRMEGHEVRVASDGVSALESATAWLPDVVLMDIGMPHMDGYEVARRMRERPALKHIVLVAHTGYGQGSDRERSLEAGFDHHLVKPASIDRIHEIASSTLKERSSS